MTGVKKFEFDEWPKLIKHIRDLNAQGYLDHYIERLKCSFCTGWFDEATDYVHICINSEHEICITGFVGLDKSNQEAMQHEGSWELESVWHNDKSVAFIYSCAECGAPIAREVENDARDC